VGIEKNHSVDVARRKRASGERKRTENAVSILLEPDFHLARNFPADLRSCSPGKPGLLSLPSADFANSDRIFSFKSPSELM
jgi:hypothetical protein